MSSLSPTFQPQAVDMCQTCVHPSFYWRLVIWRIAVSATPVVSSVGSYDRVTKGHGTILITPQLEGPGTLTGEKSNLIYAYDLFVYYVTFSGDFLQTKTFL